MKSHSTITMKQSESPKEVACSYLTAPSSIHKLFTENSSSEKIYDNISLACSTPSSQKIHDNFSSACSTLYIQTESLSSPTPQQGLPLPFFPVKLNLNLKPNSPVSCFSNSQYSEPMVPRSTFCTSLYMSSSKSSEAHRQPCNLPFLPHPSTCDRLGSSVHSSKSPLLLSGDINDQCNEGECSEDITKDFLNLPLDASDSSFHGENYASNSLSFTEQLELQILSEQLDIAITDTGENPGLGEIFDMPQISSTHKTDSKCNENHVHLVPPIDTQTRSSPSDSRTAAVHKPRLRWTLELHERFIEAINKLDEAEKATPKGILKLMNVEGLTIYHVKSHLQKYRLAKYLPEAKEDKGSSSGEKKGASIRNERESGIKRGMQVTEALRLQMEVQKQLHEQLEVQRALQLRIEEQAMYLQKILEHQNASNPFIPSLNLEPSSESQLNSPNNASSQQAESTSSLPLKKHKSTGSDSMDCDLPEYRKQTRVEAKEEITSDSLSIEDQMSALASSPLI